MGKRYPPASRSSSPIADRLLLQQEIDAAIGDLTVPHRRKEAYWKLRGIGSPARPAVEEGLLADDADLRLACTILIDRLAGPDSFELMLLLLEDADGRVRAHAMHALACDRCKSDDVCALPRDDLIPIAARLLADDPQDPVRSIALEVLARWVHHDAAAYAAIEKASVTDPSPAVRKKAKWFLPGGKHYERTKPRVRRNSAARS
ncbi:MAG TPA: HEAT repeat domain-containing protein [Acidimicrobiales bacterium]|nr:HEAT repeat domain-containing protein [Acidimicrobiales bacterium]